MWTFFRTGLTGVLIFSLKGTRMTDVRFQIGVRVKVAVGGRLQNLSVLDWHLFKLGLEWRLALFQGKGEMFTYFLVGDSHAEDSTCERLRVDLPAAHRMAAFTSCPADVGRTRSREGSPALRGTPANTPLLLTRRVSNSFDRAVLRSPMTDVTFVWSDGAQGRIAAVGGFRRKYFVGFFTHTLQITIKYIKNIQAFYQAAKIVKKMVVYFIVCNPLNSARESGGALWAPPAVSRAEHQPNRILCILALKYDI